MLLQIDELLYNFGRTLLGAESQQPSLYVEVERTSAIEQGRETARPLTISSSRVKIICLSS